MKNLNLRAERARKGLTQEELGKMAELSGLTVRLIETGRVDPKISTIKKLANALGVPVESIIKED